MFTQPVSLRFPLHVYAKLLAYQKLYPQYPLNGIVTHLLETALADFEKTHPIDVSTKANG